MENKLKLIEVSSSGGVFVFSVPFGASKEDAIKLLLEEGLYVSCSKDGNSLQTTVPQFDGRNLNGFMRCYINKDNNTCGFWIRYERLSFDEASAVSFFYINQLNVPFLKKEKINLIESNNVVNSYSNDYFTVVVAKGNDDSVSITQVTQYNSNYYVHIFVDSKIEGIKSFSDLKRYFYNREYNDCKKDEDSKQTRIFSKSKLLPFLIVAVVAVLSFFTGRCLNDSRPIGIDKIVGEANSSVFVCTGQNAKKYHSSPNCNWISNCSGEIKQISVEEAESHGLLPCRGCYKNN